jgi:hypothetical protein
VSIDEANEMLRAWYADRPEVEVRCGAGGVGEWGGGPGRVKVKVCVCVCAGGERVGAGERGAGVAAHGSYRQGLSVGFGLGKAPE